MADRLKSEIAAIAADIQFEECNSNAPKIAFAFSMPTGAPDNGRLNSMFICTANQIVRTMDYLNKSCIYNLEAATFQQGDETIYHFSFIQ